MSISFYGYVLQGETWAWPEAAAPRLSPYRAPASWDWRSEEEPPANPDYDARLDVNLSHANAREVLGALGIGDMEDVVPMAIREFRGRVTSVLRQHIGRRSPKLESFEDREPGRAQIIFCGRRAGYIEETLHRLAVLAGLAAELGATHIGWG